MTAALESCVFCQIVAGTAPARFVHQWDDAVAFVPLNPVTDGHVLVVPTRHVRDAAEDPAVTAATMRRAAELAAGHDASNILTSIGAAATQSVFHLHIHVIRRTFGDQLMVPWGTTGDPHAPHSCARLQQAEAALERVRDHLNTLDGIADGIASCYSENVAQTVRKLAAAMRADIASAKETGHA